jgi:hypothetical protein
VVTQDLHQPFLQRASICHAFGLESHTQEAAKLRDSSMIVDEKLDLTFQGWIPKPAVVESSHLSGGAGG